MRGRRPRQDLTDQRRGARDDGGRETCPGERVRVADDDHRFGPPGHVVQCGDRAARCVHVHPRAGEAVGGGVPPRVEVPTTPVAYPGLDRADGHESRGVVVGQRRRDRGRVPRALARVPGRGDDEHVRGRRTLQCVSERRVRLRGRAGAGARHRVGWAGAGDEGERDDLRPLVHGPGDRRREVRDRTRPRGVRRAVTPGGQGRAGCDGRHDAGDGRPVQAAVVPVTGDTGRGRTGVDDGDAHPTPVGGPTGSGHVEGAWGAGEGLVAPGPDRGVLRRPVLRRGGAGLTDGVTGGPGPRGTVDDSVGPGGARIDGAPGGGDRGGGEDDGEDRGHPRPERRRDRADGTARGPRPGS